MSTPADRSRLLDILRAEAVLHGEFRLASGRTSSTYLDCRRATLHPEGALLIASALLDWMEAEGLQADCIGGPTLGADPIVGAVVALSARRPRPLPGFLVRKETKEHGTGKLIEGQWKKGWKAIVVEDTVTSGGSFLKAIHAAEAAGMTVVATACVVDREEGAAAALAAYRFHSLFTMKELLGA